MKLWGKTQMQLDAERHEMIARREYLARRDRLQRQRAMTPGELGRMYGDRLAPSESVEPPHARLQAMHFGTDIPAPTMEEAEMARAVDHGSDDAGHADKWIAAVAFLLPIALVLALVYFIRQ